MTDHNPSLPGCGSFRELSGLDRHAPGCPNSPNPAPEPREGCGAATDEELKIWQERPCGDTQCRCTELHLDKAIARIAALKAEVAAYANEQPKLNLTNVQLRAKLAEQVVR